MRKPVTEEGHWIRKRRGTWIIAVPPEVRKLLGITHRVRLYWHLARPGEAVLAARAERTRGRAPVRALARELAQVTRERDAAHERDALRDRAQYAEGFAHGYIQADAMCSFPEGRAALRARVRAAVRAAFPEAAKLTDPKQVSPRPAPAPPRWNARRRRAEQDKRLAQRRPVRKPTAEAPPPRVAVPEGYELERRPSAVEGLDLAEVKDR